MKLKCSKRVWVIARADRRSFVNNRLDDYTPDLTEARMFATEQAAREEIVKAGMKSEHVMAATMTLEVE